MEIAIALYPDFTALDAVGPYEVLSRLPGAEVKFVARAPGHALSDTGSLAILARYGLEEVPAPDILLVPGGPGDAAACRDEALLAWIRAAHARTTWTTSVCTGSLVLAAAGVLEGVEATTHWNAMEELASLGAKPVSERWVRSGKIMTAAGVSAGIDMALRLASEIAGPLVAQAIQLGIEYDPRPPFDAGHPAKAPAEVTEIVSGFFAGARAARKGA